MNCFVAWERSDAVNNLVIVIMELAATMEYERDGEGTELLDISIVTNSEVSSLTENKTINF